MKKNKIILLTLLVTIFNSFASTHVNSGDNCSEAIIIPDSGKYTSDVENNNKWYSYTNNTNNYQLITVSSCGLTSLDTYLYFYKNCNSNSILDSDQECSSQSKLTYLLVPGQNLLIEWSNEFIRRGNFVFNWQLSIKSPDPQTYCNDALNVSIGEHSTDNSNGALWYSFTNTGKDTTFEISSYGKTIADTRLEAYHTCTDDTAFLIVDNISNADSGSLQSRIAVKLNLNETILFNWDVRYIKDQFNWEIKMIDPSTPDPFPLTAVVDNNYVSKFEFYPTITTGLINFTLPVDNIEIMTLQGYLVYKIVNPKDPVNVSDLPNGHYILKSTINNKVVTKIFTKE